MSQLCDNKLVWLWNLRQSSSDPVYWSVCFGSGKYARRVAMLHNASSLGASEVVKMTISVAISNDKFVNFSFWMMKYYSSSCKIISNMFSTILQYSCFFVEWLKQWTKISNREYCCRLSINAIQWWDASLHALWRHAFRVIGPLCEWNTPISGWLIPRTKDQCAYFILLCNNMSQVMQ